MTITLLGNNVAVEKLKKAAKSSEKSWLTIPEGDEYYGTIVYLSKAVTHLEVGQKVYFHTNYQQSRILGRDLCVMDAAQIYAVVSDT